MLCAYKLTPKPQRPPASAALLGSSRLTPVDVDLADAHTNRAVVDLMHEDPDDAGLDLPRPASNDTLLSIGREGSSDRLVNSTEGSRDDPINLTADK